MFFVSLERFFLMNLSLINPIEIGKRDFTKLPKRHFMILANYKLNYIPFKRNRSKKFHGSENNLCNIIFYGITMFTKMHTFVIFDHNIGRVNVTRAEAFQTAKRETFFTK
jgi:hypothetical protein